MTTAALEDTYLSDRPVRTLVRLYSGQRWRLGLAAVAFAAKHSPVWVMPVLTADVIDIVVEHRPLQELWTVGALMGLFIAQNLPLATLYIRQLSVAIRTVETNLRMALCRRLQELSIGYHRRVSAGVLQAKIVRDVENVVESTRQTFDSGMAATTTLVGALVLTAIRVPEFLPVFALTVPAAAALVAAMRRRMAAHNAVFRTEVERMSARVSEMTHLIPITRAHALERSELDRVDATLVGPSGSGKSTLLNMVIGFLAPQSGHVRLDGRDLTEIDLRTYRRFLAVVPQESLLFEGTVRDNVTYGNADLSDHAVQQALRDANALDTASERLVQEALARLLHGRTTFVVAHRLSTIRGAHRIAVMRAGRLEEIGSHAELMAAGGSYAEMQHLSGLPR